MFARGKRETAKATFDTLILWKIPRSGTSWPIGRTNRAGRDSPLPLPRARQGTAGAHCHSRQRDSVPLAPDVGAHHLDHPWSPVRSCARHPRGHAAILRRQPARHHDRWTKGVSGGVWRNSLRVACGRSVPLLPSPWVATTNSRREAGCERPSRRRRLALEVLLQKTEDVAGLNYLVASPGRAVPLLGDQDQL